MQDKPLLVYNADEQRLVGVFGNSDIVRKFIFGLNSAYKQSERIRKACLNKNRLPSGNLGFNVAVRYAKDEHIIKMDKKKYLILDETVTISHEFESNIRLKYNGF